MPWNLPSDQGSAFRSGDELYAATMSSLKVFVDGLETDLDAKADVTQTTEVLIGRLPIPTGSGANGRIASGVFSDIAKPSWITYGNRGSFTLTGRYPAAFRGFRVESWVGGAVNANEAQADFDNAGGGNVAVVGFNDDAYVTIQQQTEPTRNQPRYIVNTYGDSFQANSELALYVLFGGAGPQGPPGDNDRIEPVTMLPDADLRPLGEVRATAAGVFSNQDRAGEPNEIAGDVSVVDAGALNYEVASDGNSYRWWGGSNSGTGGVLGVLYLSKTYNPSAPAGPFYLRFFENDGSSTNIGAVSRATGLDTADGWAYSQTATRINENTGSVRAAVYSDTAYSTQQKIRSANEWRQVTGSTQGLTQAEVDARIDVRRPNPFTTADETKLDGIETAATADQTGEEMVTALEGLSGGDRLRGSAIRNIDEGFTDHHEQIIAAFSGTAGYSQSSPDAQLAETRQASSGSAIPQLSYDKTTYTQAAQIANGWIQVRILKRQMPRLADFRIVVGMTNYAGSGWRFIAEEDDTGIWAYYEQQVPMIAAGTIVLVEIKNQLRLDATGATADVTIGSLPTIHPSYYGTDSDETDIGYHELEAYAVSGTTARIPQNRLPFSTGVVHTGAATGLNVELSTRSVRSNLTLFSPVFDLDSAQNQTGVFEADATLTLTERTSNSVGFTTAQPAVDTTSISGLTFATVMRASTDYASGARNGVELGSTGVFLGSTQLGTLRVMLAKNSNNQVGYYLDWAAVRHARLLLVAADDDAGGGVPAQRGRDRRHWRPDADAGGRAHCRAAPEPVHARRTSPSSTASRRARLPTRPARRW